MSRPGHALSRGALLLAVWLGSPGPAGAEPTLRIGATLSQTGPYGLLGQNQLRGYRLCVNDANAQGGVLGRPIELVVEDDRSDAATAARLYERLLSRDKVEAVLGPYSSPITDAVADLAERRIARGTRALADARGLGVAVTERYARGHDRLSAILAKVRAADPDVLAAATCCDDAVAVTRRPVA